MTDEVDHQSELVIRQITYLFPGCLQIQEARLLDIYSVAYDSILWKEGKQFTCQTKLQWPISYECLE